MNDILSIAVSGLRANSTKLAGSANNIANLNTTGELDSDNPDTTAYAPVDTVFQSADQGGVRADVIPRKNPYTTVYDPSSAYANADGVLSAPNISLEREIVDAKVAEIAYKANAKMISVARESDETLLDTLT